MNRKIIIAAVAIIAVGVSAGFLIREQTKQPSNTLTAADEKLMRTPQGVIPMPPEAMRAMENANKRRP